MQQLLSRRLSWNRLRIRAKIGALIGIVLTLMLILTAINVLLLGQLSAQLRDSVDRSIELRSQAQDIQLAVESLQRIQQRLMSDFNQRGFDPATTPLRTEYDNRVSELLDRDIPELRARAQELTADANERVEINAEFDRFETSIEDSQENFNRLMGAVDQLSDLGTGALYQLRSQEGDVLEALTLRLENPDLLAQMILVRSLESTLIETGTVNAKNELRQAVSDYRILYQSSTPLTSQDPVLLGRITSYLNEVDNVYNLLYELDLINRTGNVALDRARNTASRLGNIANEQASVQAVIAQERTRTLQRRLIAGLVVQAVGVMVVMLIFGRSIANSLQTLLHTVRRFEQGNFRTRAQVPGDDEFAELGQSFNAMAGQLSDLVGRLEARVAERTRDLVITEEIAEAVVARRDPRELMQQVVDLVRERFDFYHVQVFLVDDNNENAILVASTGAAGRTLLARRHSLPVGSQSVIGQVTGQGEAVIALDTDTSTVHRRNELLPDTRSEMALPMRIGDHIIGALDVQSVAPNAFDQDTVAVFQVMADQLAIALENARLHARYEDAIAEMQAMERQITAETWRTYQQTRNPNAPLGFVLQGNTVVPYGDQPPSALQEAIQDGTIVAKQNGDNDIQLALPIRVRGEVIGAFGFGGEHLENLTVDDIALIEAVIDRVGLALENMRLVEQTARRAEYEQIVNEITAKIVGSTDVNFILQTTVKELGRALRAPQTSVQLRRESTGTRHDQ